LKRVLTLAGALALLAAPTATALPGDPGFEPLTPADGATLPVDPGGIGVTFTCPVYRKFTTGDFSLYGGPVDYGVSFSTSSALGPDGRLADLVAIQPGSATVGGNCASAMSPGGAERPQETPGTYYWQVWRLCTGCQGSYETGPVRSFTLRSGAKVRVGSPGKAYAGYPLLVPVTAAGAPNGAKVTLQRKQGRGWRAVGSDAVVGERAEPIVELPRGTVRLRAVVRIGGQSVTSPVRGVAVARAAGWSTGSGDDGAYAGRAGGERSVRLRVTDGGRSIKGFKAYVAMLCPSVTPGQFTTQIGTAATGRVRIAPDGRFVAATAPGRKTAIGVRGRLRRGAIVGGRVELSVGTCTGSVAYSARRTGS
jgi:hypothetical protein